MSPTELIQAAKSIVTQHNLFSTATEAERLATLRRYFDWWNNKVVPFLQITEAISLLTVFEVNMNDHFEYEVPESLPEWAWIQGQARFAHVGNGEEDGVWEFMVNMSLVFGPEKPKAAQEIPSTLLTFFEQAEAVGAAWIMFYQA